MIIITSDAIEGQKVFTFDQVFTEQDSQQFIYEQSAFSLVEQVVDGYNGTIFAYGQTVILFLVLIGRVVARRIRWWATRARRSTRA